MLNGQNCRGLTLICKRCQRPMRKTKRNYKICSKCRTYRPRRKPVRFLSAHQRRRIYLPRDLTNRQWFLTLEYFDWRCIYCDRPLEKPIKEHFIPESRGGGYTLGNILPSCHEDNWEKSNDMPWIYCKKQGINYKYLVERIRDLVVFVQEVVECPSRQRQIQILETHDETATAETSEFSAHSS